ncbi:Exosome complex component RRP4 [Nowakowskiella sp. JEL0407]|nr:Exosome complex component RRP4 [Nowakowskiella sp. JEL0407]
MDDVSQDHSPLIVSPGQTISNDSAFMRGHGTYDENSELVASVAGVIERVNKLVVVKPLRSRYIGEIGDVVVGRVTELSMKIWKVDINARHEAVLLLSSINLPGGVQRRRSESDELQMREYFQEGHLLSAEIQNFVGDGVASLHTRNIKYGKLRNGSLVVVPSALIKRSKSHFASLPCGVDVVLGLNGYIWVSKHTEITPEMANQPEGFYVDVNEEMDISLRQKISRVCNCITALSNCQSFINDTMIIFTYDASMDYTVTELLDPEVQQLIVSEARAKLH